ncbi:MAG: DUF1800 domain-containing protein [Aureispira sp.]
MTNEEKIKHVYGRVGFGLSPEQYQRLRRQPLSKVINNLFEAAKKGPQKVECPNYSIPNAQQFKEMGKKERKQATRDLRKLIPQLNLNWTRQMVKEEEGALIEKMTLFWHGHFACAPKRVDFANQQLQTLRQHALGNFRDLLVAISKDAAMIIYLNNQQNRKAKPNENYAREVMELFTLGRGHYTEQDVKAAARAFTGWFTNRFTGEFAFKARQHDEEHKTFMGRTGNWNGEDIIDFILENRQTARFLAEKLYSYFVNEEPNEEAIKGMANRLYESNYDIKATMRYLLDSEWFYAPENVGNRIKSPIELLVGLSKTLHLKFDDSKAMILPQRALGQVLFQPPNVAGWTNGKAWIDNATLLLRLNLSAFLLKQKELTIRLPDQPERKQGGRFNGLNISNDIAALEKAFTPMKEAEQIKEITAYLLATPINGLPEEWEKWIKSREEDRLRTRVMVLMSLPEYQLC